MSTRRNSHWSALAQLLRPDAKRWVVLVALVGAVTGGTVVGPLIVRHLVDRATDGITSSEVVRLGVIFVAIAVVTQVVNVVAVAWATTTAWKITNGLRVDLTRHVLGLDHEFHRTHTPGELIQRVDGDITHVSEFLSKVIPRLLSAAMLVIGVATVLFVLDWRLGIGAVVFVGIGVLMVQLMRHHAIAESSDEMSAYARLYGGIEERLNAVEDLRSNGAQAHALGRFIDETGAVLQSAVRRERAFLRLWWALQMTFAFGSAAALAAAGGLVDRDLITLGTGFLLFQYVLLLQNPLEELVQQLETMQKASGAMRRTAELISLEPSIVDTGSVSPASGALAVQVDAVDFAYADDGEPILADITLGVDAGRSVGVVGRTGSGKTTFSRLLLRLVEPTAGTLRLGGVAIADIPLGELRRRVALVPQDVELFAGTVRDNVTLFDDVPSDADVEQALRAVGLDVLVAGGIDRPLGAGGVGLSAGEAQLVALARVWLRQPDLVVLDEATARVDPGTEQKIADAVKRLMHGRTTFVIAHRLSTLDAVDEIVVFDHGRIREHGTRAELVAADSHFAHLLAVAAATGILQDEPDDEPGDATSVALDETGATR